MVNQRRALPPISYGILLSFVTLLSCFAPQASAQCGLNSVSLNLSSSDTTVVFGTPVTFAVSVASAPPGFDPSTLGPVTFSDNGVPISGATLPFTSSGVVSISDVLDLGNHMISVSSSNPCVTFVTSSVAVAVIPPTLITVAITPSAPTVGQSVTIVAAINTAGNPAAPTGTIQFFDNGKSLGTVTVAGAQAGITATLTAGAHAITATYSGDDTYPPASAIGNVSVYRLTTSLVLSSSAPSSTFGAPIAFTTKLTTQAAAGAPAPTGQVQFVSGCLCGIFGALINPVVLGTAAVSGGTASLTVNSLPIGSTQVIATYSGDANWAASTSNAVTQNIAQGTATTTAWTSLSVDTSQVSLAVRVAAPAGTATPTGSVQFVDSTNSTILGSTTLSAGAAILTLPVKPDLTGHPLMAVYSGDSNFAPSTSDPMRLISITDVAGSNPASVAPNEIVSIYGGNLASAAAGQTMVQLADSSGATNPAAVLFVSPTQINVALPPSAATGPAALSVTSPAGITFSRAVTITTTAPTLFSTTGQAGGPAAALIVHVHPGGSQDVQNASSPIVFGSDTLYLVLFGTGIRLRPDLKTVTCSINGQSLPVAYAGLQPQTAGLDQVNVLLPSSLQGAGKVNVTVAIGTQVSNPVTLTFQ